MKGIIICTWHLFLKHFKYNLILIIQICITFLIFLGFMGRVQYILNSKNVTDTFRDCKAYYYFPYTFTGQEYCAKKILTINNIKNTNVGTVYYMIADCNGEDIPVICYNETIINYANIKHIGRWLDEYSNKEKIVPVIAVGDKYQLDEKLVFKDKNNEDTNAIVIGIIEEDENILTFDTGADQSISSIDFFVSKPCCELIVPFECTKISSLSEKHDVGKAYGVAIESHGEIIIPESDISDTELKKIFEWYGSIVDIKAMIHNYKENIHFDIIANGVVLAVFLVLTIAGVGGINGMQSRLNKKNYVIYYMIGMCRRSCAITEFLRSSLVVIAGILLSSSIFLFDSVRNMLYSNNNVLINWRTILCAFFTLELISCIISIPYILALGKGSIIKNYKSRE